MKKQILLASLLGALTLPAMAEGVYLVGDVGQGKLEVDLGDDYNFNKTATAYSLGVGFDLNQFFAVELAYRDLGDIRTHDNYTDGGVSYKDTYTTTATAFQASVVGSLPVSDVVSVFGRFGVAKIDIDDTYKSVGGGETYTESFSESKTKALFGIGASFAVTPQLALRAEYNQYAKIDDTKLSALTVGATYHF